MTGEMDSMIKRDLGAPDDRCDADEKEYQRKQNPSSSVVLSVIFFPSDQQIRACIRHKKRRDHNVNAPLFS
jgi:hypothetical protein